MNSIISAKAARIVLLLLLEFVTSHSVTKKKKGKGSEKRDDQENCLFSIIISNKTSLRTRGFQLFLSICPSVLCDPSSLLIMKNLTKIIKCFTSVCI